MRARWVLVFGFVLLLGAPFGAVPTTAAPSPPDALCRDLDELLADSRLRGSHAGVVVRDPVTDEVLYRRRAHDRATPASNAKLFTSVAALETLGPGYRFRTEVATAAERHGPVLAGDVHLRGTGDPTMLAADYERLAARIADAGIRHVRGRLIVDDNWFDDVPLGTGWMWNDEPYYYAGPVSALSVAPNTDYDAGTVIVRVSPGARGRPVRVRLDPPTDAVEIVNRARTGAPDSSSTLSVRREHGSDRVVVSGTLPAGAAPVEEFSSVPDPTRYAADAFARALAAHGVSIGGVAEGVTPPGARVLAAHESMTLAELMVPFLKLSNNGHAEVLVKAMGREVRGEGSWSAGLAVLDEVMRRFGVDPAAYRLVDGSGLSTMDKVTPGQIAALLDNARSRPWFGTWYAALPIAGAEERMVGGTLRGRMNGTPAEHNIHAKTGSMTGVTALSGYVTAANGRRLVFSVLFNEFLSAAPRDLQDAIAVRLARYGSPRTRTGDAAPRVPSSRPPADDPVTRVDESALECSWSKAC